jgi:exopolysaccharide production protein ExoQ
MSLAENPPVPGLNKPGVAAPRHQRGRGSGFPVPRVAPDQWVQPLAVTILVLALNYVVFGGLGDSSTDTSQTDHVNPLNSLIWLGLLALALPILMRRWREVLALLQGSWLLMLLFVYFALSISWALDPTTSSRRLLFTGVQIALSAILLSGIRRAPVAHVAIAMVCSCAALADLLSWIIAPGYTMTSEGFAGLQGQKNQAGLLMMYGCLATVPCIFLMKRWVWKILLLLATLVMAGLLVATRSTTSQSVVISAAVVMPILVLIAKLPQRLIWAIASITTLGIATSLLAYLAWCGATDVDPMLPLRGATFTARTDIWSFVIDEIKKRPLYGAGYSSFWSIDPAVQPSLKSDQWFGVYAIINEAHDGYLDLLATTGIFGLVGGLTVLFRAIFLAAQAINQTPNAVQSWGNGQLSRPTAIFYLALLLGLVMHNFTESNLFSNNSLLAVALLLCVLDLEKWRILTKATKRCAQQRRDRGLRNPLKPQRPAKSAPEAGEFAPPWPQPPNR